MMLAEQAERFLVFTLGQGVYALPAGAVRDCLSLPRLTPLDETAPWVIGAFDLHGELTPVISLDVYRGGLLPPAGMGDLVIVTTVSGHPLALHAEDVLGVEREASPPPLYADATAGVETPAAARLGSEPALAPLEISLLGGPARVVLPERLPLAAADVSHPETTPKVEPEQRLRAFERTLAASALAALEARAARYSGLPITNIRPEPEPPQAPR